MVEFESMVQLPDYSYSNKGLQYQEADSSGLNKTKKPKITADSRHADVKNKFKEKVKDVCNKYGKRLSKKGMNRIAEIRLTDLPGEDTVN